MKNAVIFGSNAGKQGGGGSGPIQKFSKVLDDERWWGLSKWYDD